MAQAGILSDELVKEDPRRSAFDSRRCKVIDADAHLHEPQYLRLSRVSWEKTFSTEARWSQSSENFVSQTIFTPRSPRLGGAISQPCFTESVNTRI